MTSSTLQTIVDLPLSVITADPDQPRKFFEKEALSTLAANIGEHGVLEPILVRPDLATEGAYIIIAGERRYRASTIAGMPTIPAIVRADFDAAQLEEVSISENTARQDLNPIEEAKGFLKLFDRMMAAGGTRNDVHNKIGVKVGRTGLFVEQRLSLLTLSDQLQRLIEVGQLGAVNGALIAKLNPEYQGLAVRALVTQNLSYNGLNMFVNELLERQNNTELFTPEQVKTRREAARGLRVRFERTVDMAIDGINELVDKRNFQLLPEALEGDHQFFIDKLSKLEGEIRRLRAGVESAKASREVIGG